MNLRKQARNRPCMVRIPGVCDGGGETTVLAHYRLAGYCGMGMKTDDAIAAWCCAPCHEYVGDRHDDLAIGALRTIAELRKEGKL